MCDFILASVDRDYTHIFRKGMGFHLSETDSKNWISKYHKNDISYYVMRGQCSCELTVIPLKSLPIDEEELKNLRRKTIDKFSKPKFRKRGWTKEKIETEIEKVIFEAKQSATYKRKFGLNETLIHNFREILKHIDRVSFYIFTASGTLKSPTVMKHRELDINVLQNNPCDIDYNVLFDLTNRT